MKLLSSIMALVGLITTTLCIAVSRPILPNPDCTEVNNSTTACGSGNAFGNTVFEFVNLDWKYVELCVHPTRCLDDACVSTFADQDSGKNDDNNGNDNGDNDNNDKIAPHENVITAACRENELKCMARNNKGKDGAVYKCTKGMWRIILDCREYEHCVSKPTPHCTWGMANVRDELDG